MVLILMFGTLAYSQEAIQPRPSPTAIVTMKYEDSYIKITYCQPHKKGREIFGGLVPFGEVWRTGANEATEITITKDVLFNDEELNAGTYSLFTIPGRDEWTIILNEGLGQWGTYTYNPELDILRVKANAESTNGTIWEPFTIRFEQNNEKADLVMTWDDTKIRIPIEFIPEEQ